MTLVVTIEKARLDGSADKSSIDIECEAFGIFPPNGDDTGDPEDGKPTYLIFKDLSQIENHIENPSTGNTQYGIPLEALVLPHQTGGGHGDVRLRYTNATVVFMLFGDYERFFRGDLEFKNACDVLCINGDYVKGEKMDLPKYGLTAE